MKDFLKIRKTRIILTLILILAAAFRLYGLNWDSGYHLHPDERMLIMVTGRIHWPTNINNFLSPESSLNPKFFPYGSFPIYLLRFVSNLSAIIFRYPSFAQYESLNLIGRILSVIFDLGTVIMVYKIGKRIFTSLIGLVGAAFYALAAFPIQLSHFFAVDTFLSFFVILELYQLIIFYEKPSFKQAAFTGIVFGFALATKVSATVLLVSIGTAIVMDLILVTVWRIRLLIKHRKIFYSSKKKIIILKEKINTLLKFIIRTFKYAFIIVLFTGVTFIVLEPYALIDFPTFWRQTKEQQAMTKNAYVFPYTLQYVGTTPYLYPLENFVFWGAGVPLGVVSIASIIYLIIYLFKEFPKPGNEKEEAKSLILLAFFLTYLIVVGGFAVKFMRYLLPLYPMFFLFSSWLIFIISKKIKLPKKLPKFEIISMLVLFPTILWSVAFISIYSRPTTRLVASCWINENIPPGSYLGLEHWDDGLPLSGIEKYKILEMPMYEDDKAAWKWEKVNNNLKTADYLILASNRLYVPLQRLYDCQKYKVCFPKTAKYYQDLFSDKLGFQKVAEFSSYPKLKIGNWELKIDDSSADESFTVYDHPKIMIFKKI